MKNSSTLKLILVVSLISSIISCKKEDDTATPTPAYTYSLHKGYAIEYYTGKPVPYAIMIAEGSQFGTSQFVAYTVADSLGQFNPTFGGNGAYTVYATDPNPNDIYGYQSGELVVRNDSLICEMVPYGWVRYFVHDVAPANPEITKISLGPVGTTGDMQYPAFYPDLYNPVHGYVVPVAGYQNYTIPVKFITGNDGITGNDSLAFISIFTLGKDTLDVTINY